MSNSMNSMMKNMMRTKMTQSIRNAEKAAELRFYAAKGTITKAQQQKLDFLTSQGY